MSMQPLPVLARREPYRNRFITIVDEDVPDRVGNPYTYTTISCTWDVVIVVPLLPDGRLVLERIYRHPYRAQLLEFPAGGIEHGEDPLAAAGRELLEETGWSAGRLTALTSFATLPGLLHMHTHVVLAEDLTDTGSTNHEAMEHIAIELHTVSAAWAEPAPHSAFLVTGLLALERHLRG